MRRAIARSREPRDEFGLGDLVPANDDRPDDPELDALLAGLDDAIPADGLEEALADLPLDFPAVRTPVVTDLDGNPVEEESAPAPAPRRVSNFPKKGGSKPRKSFSRDMRSIKREEALSGGTSYVIAANNPIALGR